ncbi:MAG: LysM peptidoglycan-binding domain-containing protein [Anaerolineae bacterium]
MNQRLVRAAVIAVLLLSFANGGTWVHASPAAASTVHIVRWGENLTWIAARYGVTVWDIMQANGLTNADYIYVGQRLIIPAPSTPAQPTYYTVQAGDTLSGIAWRFGTTVEAIMRANYLTTWYIYVGQQLVIPGPGTSLPPGHPPVPPAQTYYIVQWGDTLSGIAWRFGTTVEAIMQANNLYSPWRIYAGQLLVIPRGTAWLPGQPPATYYTVQAGDTLSSIAWRYGTTVWALMQANNLANAALIYPGQVLVIPGRVWPTSPAPSPTPAPPPGPAGPPVVPTPIPIPPTTPVAPFPGQVWEGVVVSNTSGNKPTWEYRSIIRVSVVGLKGVPVTVSTSAHDWVITGLTGTKPEYGEFAVEFAPFTWGQYIVTAVGLNASVEVQLDGAGIAYIEFRSRPATSTPPG